MSGGHWNHLCHELNTNTRTLNLCDAIDMASRIEELGCAEAANDLRATVAMIEKHDNALDAAASRLFGILRAVDLLDSGDAHLDQVQEAFNDYKPPEAT